MEKMIEIPEAKYKELKIRAEASNIDIDLLKQFIDSFKDISEGRIY